MFALAGCVACALAAPPVGVMPLTKLAPARVVPGLCTYQYAVSTASPDCQAYCDQAAGYFYSYVWMEAARNYETALRHDPDCAIAWLGLGKALDKWGRGGKAPAAGPLLGVTGSAAHAKLPDRFGLSPADYAFAQAKRLHDRAGHREQYLIKAKLQERGAWPDTPADERKSRARATLDELLTLYDDDQEGWFARAQAAEGAAGPVPFYKALLRLNPVHPGAAHELVHYFETARRPALGWPYAEAYMASSPGMPHAFHMQAHLATRVGKWRHTTDWSLKAVELEKEYHRAMRVRPADDHQFQHHLDILTKALVHDGRFRELQDTRTEAERHGYAFRPEWFRAALLRHDWPAARAVADQVRRTDKPGGAYYGALLALEEGDAVRAAAEVDTLRLAGKSGRDTKRHELRLWEVQGRLLCRTGQGSAGVSLLKRAVAKTKDDFAHHAWGGGAYHMEAWGLGALDAGLAAEAEEAFLEALAHDAGSVRAALGLEALCQRQNRSAEASAYRKLAGRAWDRADPADLARLRQTIAARWPAPEVAGR